MTDDRQITQPDQHNIDEPELAALTIDWEEYGRHLEESDLSEEDKRACIEALWSVMVSFVDMGFRLAPVPEICGQVLPLDGETRKSTAAMLNCKDSFNTSENNADGSSLPSRRKESVHDE